MSKESKNNQQTEINLKKLQATLDLTTETNKTLAAEHENYKGKQLLINKQINK